MSVTTASSTDPTTRVGMHEALSSSVVSGDSSSRGRDATRSAASLTAFTSLPFARPGVLSAAPDRDLQLTRRERLDLELPETGAVERVGRLGTERLEVEVVRAAPNLLVDGEADANGRTRLRVRRARYATAAMISATPALSSAPSSVVPSLVTMSWPTARASSVCSAGSRTWLRIARQDDRRSRVVPCTIGLTPVPGRLGRRVDMRDAGRSRAHPACPGSVAKT